MRKKKIKSIEYANVNAESSIGDMYDLSVYETDWTKTVRDRQYTIVDFYEMERCLYFLSTEESEILLFRHMGYTSDEIWQMMGLTNMQAYRKLSRALTMHIYLFKYFQQNNKY